MPIVLALAAYDTRSCADRSARIDSEPNGTHLDGHWFLENLVRTQPGSPLLSWGGQSELVERLIAIGMHEYRLGTQGEHHYHHFSLSFRSLRVVSRAALIVSV